MSTERPVHGAGQDIRRRIVDSAVTLATGPAERILDQGTTMTPATHTGPIDDALGTWRRGELTRLLRFAEGSLREDGAAQWLDDDGRPDTTQPVQTWITSRMAHCFAVGALLGVPGAGELADRALRGLRDVLADHEYGGWFASVGPGPVARAVAAGDFDGTKAAYAHAFVVLAAASGTMAERPGARELLDSALAVLDERFWEAGPRLHADESSRDWSVLDDYRGVNANMHAVEALLAAHDATGDREWLDRAASIADRVIAWAAANEWRIPEHFDVDWTPLPEFNADRPRDQFKPYGSTPGHGLEWARLILQVDIAQAARAQEAGRDDATAEFDDDAAARPVSGGLRTEAAVALFDRAVADGWDAERGGFVYTVDWAGEPVEPRRFHWVAAEAVAAAGVLGRVTGDPRYAALAAGWWEYVRAHLVDAERGSWHHELDTENRPSGLTWVGKPDVYHAAQAVILPDLPLTGSVAASARAAGSFLG